MSRLSRLSMLALALQLTACAAPPVAESSGSYTDAGLQGDDGCGADCEVLSNEGIVDKYSGARRVLTRHPAGAVNVTCRFAGEIGAVRASARGTRIVSGPYITNNTQATVQYSGLGGYITLTIDNSCTLGLLTVTQSR